MAHGDQRAALVSTVAEAAGIIHEVGDPCYDRAVSARPQRRWFRRAAGVEKGQKLVVVTSTWGPAGSGAAILTSWTSSWTRCRAGTWPP
ncbi:hypothetical protein KGD82_24960 [Nocardiopsis eucommiae]|uniref:Uncharacterized protein n=1 Tax=Nocardiopsis eucommiae TaxID=2831970 RepID=A0A975QKH9_9ACTN|nr:hypothetical protein KGD82_24960 [Nocardiopsis eucommiae]